MRLRLVLSALVLLAACDGGEPLSPDAATSDDDGGVALCSEENPTGACEAGSRCRAGRCIDESLFCSDERPSGLCTATDERCFEGSCVPEDTLCSDANSAGLCPGALLCRAGVCATEQPCSPEEPLGFCPAGEACVDGTCVGRDTTCSEENPTGVCPDGQSCVEGVCAADGCSPEHPEGPCPGGQTCVEGVCMGSSDACSPANPTGSCPSGRTCVDGVCMEPGGACSPAHPTGSCPAGEVCEGGACMRSAAPPSCTNGAQDGLETDVDCGGPRCEPCATSRTCAEDLDCRSLSCDAGACAPGVPSYLTDEDFETGDLSRFAYGLSGEHPFEIETDASACHGGSYCLRSSVYHEGGETVRISLRLSVREDGEVTFWARTHSEPGEHVLRFYVDDVVEVEVSGDTAWTQYRVPVSATGPGGSDRVLAWEYTRSDFVEPSRAPWNEVWIDDVDFPSWNTQPTVPVLQSPANGAVITDAMPELRWRSVDPDFDTIIYEMQLDTDPSFATATSTGETMTRTHAITTALTPDTTYFWRVRSKDDSDYRWSEWSRTSSFRHRPESPYPVLFRQTTGSELALSAFDGAEVFGDTVRVLGEAFTTTVTGTADTYNGSVQLRDLPRAREGASGQLTVTASYRGNTTCNGCQTYQSYSVPVTADGTSVGSLSSSNICSCASVSRTFTLSNVQSSVADGALNVGVTARYNSYCGGSSTFLCGAMSATLTYDTVEDATVTSPPIILSDLAASSFEHVWVDADPTVRFQVLGPDLAPVSDAQVPGNAAGLAPGTHVLWNLDPAAYPVIHLRATLRASEVLRGWEVTANDGYAFHFMHDGDAEGWSAADDGATPSLSVTGGVLRVESTAAGSNPRIELRLPAEIDASRFTRMRVRLRTSNNHADDTVTLYWENNYGMFDAVRSLTASRFLFEYQDVEIDLTTVPTPPAQPWQGRVVALRIDPVVRFTDAAGDPADGWFEIDSIHLY